MRETRSNFGRGLSPNSSSTRPPFCPFLGSWHPTHPPLSPPPPQVKEFGDSTDLFAEERQQEIDDKAKEVRTRQEQIPGLINPHQRTDDMTDF